MSSGVPTSTSAATTIVMLLSECHPVLEEFPEEQRTANILCRRGVSAGEPGLEVIGNQYQIFY